MKKDPKWNWKYVAICNNPVFRSGFQQNKSPAAKPLNYNSMGLANGKSGILVCKFKSWIYILSFKDLTRMSNKPDRSLKILFRLLHG